MKIVFSTKNVNRPSFLDTCRYAYDYGFEGFEIYDAIKERASHHDSILRRDRVSDARRKLVNRGLTVAALSYPHFLESEEATAESLVKYVDMAANAGVANIIVRVDEKPSFDMLKEKLGARGGGSAQMVQGSVGAKAEDIQKLIEYVKEY